MLIRNMTHPDIDAAIKIHKKAFEGFFLSRMGTRFLREYYQTVVDFENSIALVAQDSDDNCILGFAVGFQNPKDFYALFKQRCKGIIPTMALAVLRDPRLAVKILRNTRRIKENTQQSLAAVELSSIAVDQPKKGVGGALLKAFINRAKLKGETKIILTTDAQNNNYVRKFYEKHGFRLERIENRGSRAICYYIFNWYA